MQTPQLRLAAWRKSTHSSGQEGACVELADLTTTVGVRDSKDPDGDVLQFDRRTFTAFAAQIRTGVLDL